MRYTFKVGNKYVWNYYGIPPKDFEINAKNKFGMLEDLEEEIGVNDLISFLKWCVMFRNNFINRSFDDMVAFYKRAMCETEKDKSE